MILGYPIEAQSVLVSGVPSMHICFSFLPELLSITSNERRLFGINLLAHLARTYSIPKTLDLCRLALRCGMALATTLDGLAELRILRFSFIFALTSKLLRILMEHIVIKSSLDFDL